MIEFLEPKRLGKSWCSIDPLIGAAALSAGGSIFSGLMGASGASKAAASARDAALINQQTAYTLFNRTSELLDPFVQPGKAAAGQLGDLVSGKSNIADIVSQDPLYKWQLEESQRMNERGLARQGLTNSGAALELNRRTLAQLTGETAQRQFQNIYNVAALGESAAAKVGAAATNTAGIIGQSNTAAAGQAGNAYINQGVAYGNIGQGAANAGLGAYGMYLNQQNFQTLMDNWRGGSFAPSTNTGGLTGFNVGSNPFLVNTPGGYSTTGG